MSAVPNKPNPRFLETILEKEYQIILRRSVKDHFSNHPPFGNVVFRITLSHHIAEHSTVSAQIKPELAWNRSIPHKVFLPCLKGLDIAN